MKSIFRHHKTYLKLVCISCVLFASFFVLPKNSFAENDNEAATCYRCVIGQINAQLQKGKTLDEAFHMAYIYLGPCNSNSCNLKGINDLLTTFSGLKQSGPAQPDQPSCKQFLDKVINNKGMLSSAMDTGTLQPDRVLIQEIYNDLIRMGTMTGGFCSEDMLSGGDAKRKEEEQRHADCGICSAYCKSQPSPSQCFYEECSGIVSCTYSGNLTLNPFTTFTPINGGFGFTPNANVSEYIQDVLSIGSFIFGGLAVLKIIFGGVMYATAAGNAQRISDAKSHILYALIGLALVLGANIVLGILGAGTLY